MKISILPVIQLHIEKSEQFNASVTHLCTMTNRASSLKLSWRCLQKQFCNNINYGLSTQPAMSKHGRCSSQMAITTCLKQSLHNSPHPVTNLTRRMAITIRTCISFCNQPKAHFGLPWVAPGTISVNVTWMKRGFTACQTHHSMYHLSSTVSQ